MRPRARTTSESVGPCHSISELDRIGRSGPAGRGESGADSFAEQRQPLDGLVAKDEADMAIGDLAAPAAHRRSSDLLLEQTVGQLDAVVAEGGDVEQQRPGACRP